MPRGRIARVLAHASGQDAAPNFPTPQTGRHSIFRVGTFELAPKHASVSVGIGCQETDHTSYVCFCCVCRLFCCVVVSLSRKKRTPLDTRFYLFQPRLFRLHQKALRKDAPPLPSEPMAAALLKAVAKANAAIGGTAEVSILTPARQGEAGAAGTGAGVGGDDTPEVGSRTCPVAPSRPVRFRRNFLG